MFEISAHMKTEDRVGRDLDLASAMASVGKLPPRSLVKVRISFTSIKGEKTTTERPTMEEALVSMIMLLTDGARPGTKEPKRIAPKKGRGR